MPIFFTKKSCNRGDGTTPPQMPLTVKILELCIFYSPDLGHFQCVFFIINPIHQRNHSHYIVCIHPQCVLNP